jgi:hypothetical protein
MAGQIMTQPQTQPTPSPKTRPDRSDIMASIKHICYFTADQGACGASSEGQDYPAEEERSRLCHVTFCVITLQNGTVVSGVNYGSIDPTQFNAQVGREAAYSQAEDQIWNLLGYELRSKLINSEFKNA